MENVKTNPVGLDFGGNWITGAALIAVLAPVYIFYGFESAGDISEETKDAGTRVSRSMRLALIWGGVASFILTVALLLAMPAADPVGATVKGGGVPFILGQLPAGIQDVLLVLIMLAFFSCGSSIQGAGSRLAFAYARDGALPVSRWLKRGWSWGRDSLSSGLDGGGGAGLNSRSVLWYASTIAVIALTFVPASFV